MDTNRAETLADTLVGSTIGAWKAEHLINSGKSAIVLKALKGTTHAALKVFDPDLVARFGEATQLNRIKRELELVGKSHDHLIRILDGGKCNDTGHLFLVMELVDGTNLAEVTQRVPRQSIRPLISQVASAARFLEEHGLAHRDIKPDNIVVDPDFTRAKLLDLGVIRHVGCPGDTDREQPEFIGTLQYAPPEFLDRDEEDSEAGWRAVTFYQLGAVLHDMIMRRRLFDGIAPYAKLVAAIHNNIPFIAAEDVSQDLVLLAKNCLTKTPQLRCRIISWDDFSTTPPALDPRDEIRARIKKKQSLERQGDSESLASGDSIEHFEFEIRESIDALIRLECVDTDLFPPVIIKQTGSASAELRSTVTFEASPSLNLATPMVVRFFTTIDDNSSRVIQVTAQLNDGQITSIYHAAFDKPALQDAIRMQLYDCLEKAIDESLSNTNNIDATGSKPGEGAADG